MNELYRSGEIDVFVAGVATHAGRRESQHWSQPLAAGIDQVSCQIRDEAHGTSHAAMDQLVRRGHVGCDKRMQPFDGRDAV